MKKTLVAAALLAGMAGFTTTAMAAQDEVNIYSYRQAYLIEPLLEQFTKDTGIKTNVIFIKDGLADRLAKEGESSPADLVLTVDIKRLTELVKKGVTQPVKSAVLEKNIPAADRDAGNQWFGLTLRARAVFTSKDRVGKLPASFTYEDLAKPELKGKVCTRSGKHPYNVGLVAFMISHHGVEKTKAWLEGLKANLAIKPEGGDRDQIKAVASGKCDYAIGNSYYFGIMLKDEKQRPAAEKVYINFPNQETTGTHMNVSGVAMAKYAKHKAAALKLMEFLSSDKAQALYAELNNEFPVEPGVPESKLVASWGKFKRDSLSFDDLASHYNEAIKMIDEVQFDLQ